MNYCKDCKNLRPTSLECSVSPSVSRVTGKTLYTSAHIYREHDSYCGKDAVWFEPITEDADLDDLSTIPFGK